MTTRRRLLTATAVAAAAALTLAGCGTTEAADTAETTAAGEQITLTDATGAEITLDGPATKVVGTEWNVVEDLVALGVDPVGVADVAGYQAWDSAVPLTNDPADIGTRGEPSLDTIASLAPDLILATDGLSADAVTQLKEIAPVLQITSADASRQIENATDNLDLIAKATGTEDRAAEVKKAFTDAVADGRQAIADAGLEGANVAFADGYVDAGQVGIRPYAAGSLVGDVTEELGLVNAWTVEGDEAYGLATTDVEGLTQLPDDTRFLYITNTVDGDDPFADVLADNAVWTSLPFVAAGDVDRLPDGIWMFGGPAAMTAYVDAVVSTLTE
ncbi:iron-siderophore ABC transporter substrate-binding protein [Frigoribacterium faeni]|uniref:ABC transporter substrate-binding protein n=1 Tax=Frigoribacterium faeni TaxID=145483 RepID=A0A7W3JKT5_9MICO|nr:iron-siderophore ABC transporter substrate-binding protein [Frigoribacterium faeni]MBA8814534.1 iron complex transport system substrate-binding protein [Frigoribacterium faeni]BFF15954.1 siderophore ABC transporter substrate-binding protein CdtB [Microbacterium flavescens]GEK84775.1 ABC transporter substrate-binding protein [Frigoribacterium faeni]